MADILATLMYIQNKKDPNDLIVFPSLDQAIIEIKEKKNIFNLTKASLFWFKFAAMCYDIRNTISINMFYEDYIEDGKVTTMSYDNIDLSPRLIKLSLLDDLPNIDIDNDIHAKNTRICNNFRNRSLSPANQVDPEISCYPLSTLKILRNLYNARVREKYRINSDDPQVIVSSLKFYLQVETEDHFLKLFKDFREYQRHLDDFFAPGQIFRKTKSGSIITYDDDEGMAYHQYQRLMRRYEKKYRNLVNIDYIVRSDVFDMRSSAGHNHLFISPDYDFFDINYSTVHKEAFIKSIQQNIKKFQDIIDCDCTHVYLILLLDYFLQVDNITQICVQVTHSGHAQGIYINKTEGGHYMFYNSQFFQRLNKGRRLDVIDRTLDRDIRLLLENKYTNLNVAFNGKHQYENKLCVAYVYNFFITMLNPDKDYNTKLLDLSHDEDMEDDIKKIQFLQINKNMDYLFIKNYYNTGETDMDFDQALDKKKTMTGKGREISKTKKRRKTKRNR